MANTTRKIDAFLLFLPKEIIAPSIEVAIPKNAFPKNIYEIRSFFSNKASIIAKKPANVMKFNEALIPK